MKTAGSARSLCEASDPDGPSTFAGNAHRQGLECALERTVTLPETQE